jgi:hypothetical protein
LVLSYAATTNDVEGRGKAPFRNFDCAFKFLVDPTIELLDPGCFERKKLRLRMESSKIVMRFADGRVLKGYTEDFIPESLTFHFYKKNPKFSSDPLEVLVEDLKGIFLSGISREIQNPESPKKSPRE